MSRVFAMNPSQVNVQGGPTLQQFVVLITNLIKTSAACEGKFVKSRNLLTQNILDIAKVT